MKKRTMKLLTLILAWILMLSMSMTAFATEGNASDCCTTDDDGTVKCEHTIDDCDMVDCEAHDGAVKADADAGTNARTTDTTKNKCKCSEDDCDCTECAMDCGDNDCNTCNGCKSGCGTHNHDEEDTNAASDTDSNNLKTTDKGNDEKTEETKVDRDKGEALNADIANENTDTVKTGEKDMVPAIIGLASLAGIAGIMFVVYKKKKA